MKKKEQNGERIPLREKLCRTLDLRPDVLAGQGCIEIYGRGGMTVRGGGRILCYTPEEIRIRLSDGVLSICGRRLVCTSYHVGGLCIDGRIESVCFLDGEGETAR